MAVPELSIGLLAGTAAALLQTAGFAVIASAILRGAARPNCCSWLIWSLVASLAAAGSWQAGATWPLAGAVMNALGCIAVLGLSAMVGHFAVGRVDLVCLAAAGCGLSGWLATSSPVVGLALFLAADACGAVPTLRNVVVDPGAENARGWSLLALAGAAAVVSVEPAQWSWSWTGFGHWGGAVYVALVNLAVAASIPLARALRAPTAVAVRAASP
jgi:hypothetical protein